MNQRIQSLLAEYAAYHTHPVNRLLHKIAMPFIVFHVIAMLSWIPILGSVNAAHVSYIAVVAWYLSMDVRLGLVMAFLFALCFPLVPLAPVWFVVALAMVAWTVQFLGHGVWEKRSPALFTNLLQILVAPLFFVASTFGWWRVASSPGR